MNLTIILKSILSKLKQANLLNINTSSYEKSERCQESLIEVQAFLQFYSFDNNRESLNEVISILNSFIDYYDSIFLTDIQLVKENHKSYITQNETYKQLQFLRNLSSTYYSIESILPYDYRKSLNHDTTILLDNLINELSSQLKKQAVYYRDNVFEVEMVNDKKFFMAHFLLISPNIHQPFTYDFIYKNTYDIHPNFFITYYNCNNDQVKKSIELLESLYESNKQSIILKLYINLAKTIYALNVENSDNYEIAGYLSNIEELLKRNPNHLLVRIILADLYSRTNQKELATNLINEYADIDISAFLLYRCSMILDRCNKKYAAQEYIEKANELDKSNIIIASKLLNDKGKPKYGIDMLENLDIMLATDENERVFHLDFLIKSINLCDEDYVKMFFIPIIDQKNIDRIINTRDLFRYLLLNRLKPQHDHLTFVEKQISTLELATIKINVNENLATCLITDHIANNNINPIIIPTHNLIFKSYRINLQDLFIMNCAANNSKFMNCKIETFLNSNGDTLLAISNISLQI